MSRVFVVGTRGSALALKQTDMAVGALGRASRDTAHEVREIKTEGDRDQQTPLSAVAGRGVFTSDLEQALLREELDIAVHSLKDLPTTETEGLILGAILPRGDVRDAVISRYGMFLQELPPGSTVGTSSSRRVAQLRSSYPGLKAESIRGNVDTRIRKLRRGEYDAIVLAAAGLERLGRLDEATEILETDEMMPAPGQGAIALQCRGADTETLNLLRSVDHAPTRAAVTAERAVLDVLEGGCSVPVGAYASVDGLMLKLAAVVCSPDGETVIKESSEGPAADPETLGRQLGGRLLELGAAELIKQFAAASP
ncbi:MAG: hydroxymethylbilane synthase [Dehalococcoidia bacterium]